MLFNTKKRKYKKKTPKQKEEIELDEMWKQKVKDRDEWKCQICFKVFDKVNAHHILPRQIKKGRWDIHNGITLCAYHHSLGPYSAHKNSIWFTYWLKTNKPAQFKHVINKLREIGEIIR